MHPILPLLQLVDALSSIEGRKKLQKTVHILKELGVPFSEKFEYSYYGMYSPQLKNEIDALVSESLLEEESVSSSHGICYRIKAKPTLRQLLLEVNGSEAGSWIEIAKKLNSWSPQELEGISTLFFLQHSGVPSDSRLIKLLELKPHLKDLASDCDAKFDELLALKS
ncbi:MAG: hypothetical protein B9S32_13500 [Verrucomicrobia bacterium Tous-C9LFEB]|nr:MAG: hypothetical protein B9S32_13500 [Verrucomicrobia bacterium Tous-C9LFEB]